jgi:hypothetical protein
MKKLIFAELTSKEKQELQRLSDFWKCLGPKRQIAIDKLLRDKIKLLNDPPTS